MFQFPNKIVSEEHALVAEEHSFVPEENILVLEENNYPGHSQCIYMIL